ncbi:MAG: Glycosyl transferase family 39 [Candidatus Woesebacteria bacterium GW2011_GWA1_37_8]|uniref:Glycosyl transferase family 39 n=2 Tax=Candidatus Woeseibacteriota TaxID=1752722 RepID=A0A0G0LFI3_9BACT|nr:MAG: Glycosyl transferase family 39 [Microgenomates group bacterium GW2011_GWC1_37_12b]KKQ46088.1 MAG: Glycosyl transferase family 39 [Candidatus Woesebacteria bacterium GW2011_GWA1_37_8]KKQ86695.1 MAG: Glycosyl transferase family 39 [Candidatus Woesebacteria bacterium GW2011_GWB1_38_8b]
MKRIILVFILALFLRTIQISKAPIGFNPDEASFGYDAYTILKTGADQWGKKFPLVLESFGDYKAPLYSYLAIPFVWINGLNPTSVRLPNAILGSFAVLVFYFLIKEVFDYEERSGNSWFRADFKSKKEFVATLGAILFSISPWHIAMSRGAFEANLTTFFIPLSLFLFFKYLNSKKPNFLYLSSLGFGLNLFTYHSAKLVTGLVMAALALIFFKDVIRDKKTLAKSVFIFLVFLLLTAYTFLQGAGARLADVSIYKLSLNQASVERIRAYNNGLPDAIARAFHNKYQVFGKTGTSNYLSYLSPQFLFVRGAGEKTYGMSDDRGVLYWFELPLLILFLRFLVKQKIGKSMGLFVFWFLVSPIPASLAIGPGFAANRAVVMLPSVYLFLAIGAYELSKLKVDFVKFKLDQKYFILFYALLSTVFVVSFLENYFFVAPSKIAKDMLSGNLESLKYVAGYDGQIVVSRKLSEPHIYVAFVNKTNPKDYQLNSKNWNFKEKGLGWVDQMGEYRLGNYLFKNIYYEEWKGKDVILIGKPEEFPENIIPIKKFATPSGEDLIYIVDTGSSYYAKESKD